MKPAEWVEFGATLGKEVWSLVASGIQASREEMAGLVARGEAALAALKGTRTEVERKGVVEFEQAIRNLEAERDHHKNEAGELRKHNAELVRKLGDESLLDASEPTSSER